MTETEERTMRLAAAQGDWLPPPAIELLLAELDRLRARDAWKSEAVGILKALLDRSVSVDEFVSRVQTFIGREKVA